MCRTLSTILYRVAEKFDVAIRSNRLKNYMQTSHFKKEMPSNMRCIWSLLAENKMCHLENMPTMTKMESTHHCAWRKPMQNPSTDLHKYQSRQEKGCTYLCFIIVFLKLGTYSTYLPRYQHYASNLAIKIALDTVDHLDSLQVSTEPKATQLSNQLLLQGSSRNAQLISRNKNSLLSWKSSMGYHVKP